MSEPLSCPSLIFAVTLSLSLVIALFVVQGAIFYLLTIFFDINTLLKIWSGAGTVFALFLLLSAVLMMMLVSLLVRWLWCTGRITSVRALLGIVPIQPKQMLIGVGLLGTLNIIIHSLSLWLNKDPMIFMDALVGGDITWLIVAVVFAMPVCEELIFRGLMQGLLRQALPSKHGVWVSIGFSAILFALVHLQYDWFGVMAVFAMGLVFGWARTHSLWLAMVLHVLNNALAMVVYLHG